jgi:hypothetical protein
VHKNIRGVFISNKIISAVQAEYILRRLAAKSVSVKVVAMNCTATPFPLYTILLENFSKVQAEFIQTALAVKIHFSDCHTILFCCKILSFNTLINIWQ